jgi:thiol-disulfide isomerase/thioredoxin
MERVGFSRIRMGTGAGGILTFFIKHLSFASGRFRFLEILRKSKMKRFKIWAICFIIISFFFISLVPAWGREKKKIITAGDLFPEFPFPMTLSRGDIGYLGLPVKWLGLVKGDTFFLKDVKADLIILEFTNKYCYSCQLQAPAMNQLFEMVEKDEQLRGRVKFLGVGAGNNQNEVDSFKAEKKIPFPIVPDPKFLAYEAIGEPGATPFTLLIRKIDAGLMVARVKIGLTGIPTLVREMEESLRADWNAFARSPKDTSLEEEKRRKLSLPYDENQLMKKAEESMTSPKWKVLKVAKLILPDEQEIYVGEIQTGNKKTYLFSKLASRAPICDLCHAAHFFFAFDEKGMVINLLPLELTKVDNIPWDANDIEKMKKRIIGRSILQPADFDAHVDSISSATMTAALIVDSVNEAKGLYEGLKSKGYIR